MHSRSRPAMTSGQSWASTKGSTRDRFMAARGSGVQRVQSRGSATAALRCCHVEGHRQCCSSRQRAKITAARPPTRRWYGEPAASCACFLQTATTGGRCYVRHGCHAEYRAFPCGQRRNYPVQCPSARPRVFNCRLGRDRAPAH